VLAGGDADRAGSLAAQFAECGDLGLDLLEARPDGLQQPQARLGRRDAARRASEQPQLEAPSLTPALVKLRSRATIAKAARSLKIGCAID
jgi:hypothetical protein